MIYLLHIIRSRCYVLIWREIIIMMTSSNGSIFHVTGALCGEFTGHRWIPIQRPVVFYLICVWINGYMAGDLRRHRVHYDVTVMIRRHKTPRWCPMSVFWIIGYSILFNSLFKPTKKKHQSFAFHQHTKLTSVYSRYRQYAWTVFIIVHNRLLDHLFIDKNCSQIDFAHKHIHFKWMYL